MQNRNAYVLQRVVPFPSGKVLILITDITGITTSASATNKVAKSAGDLKKQGIV